MKHDTYPVKSVCYSENHCCIWTRLIQDVKNPNPNPMHLDQSEFSLAAHLLPNPDTLLINQVLA
jgi:hypothetical protein